MRRPHLVGGVGPDLDFLLAPLVVGDDAPLELLLDLLGFLLVAVEDLRPCRAGVRTSSIEIVRPDWLAKRKPRSLMLSRLVGHDRLRVVVGQLLDDATPMSRFVHRLVDQVVDVREVRRAAPR